MNYKNIDYKKYIDFYKLVIGVAFLVFFLTMTLFWFFSKKKSDEFPPTMSNCPTGWSVNTDGTCNIPTNGTNLGNLAGKGVPIYKLVSEDQDNNQTITYSTDPRKGGNILTDVYGNKIVAYTGPGSNTIFPNFPGGYDITHPEKNIVDFTANNWSKYESVLCANYKWAIKNNIHWEGVTNYNHCE
jgi:hypothetical protein